MILQVLRHEDLVEEDCFDFDVPRKIVGFETSGSGVSDAILVFSDRVPGFGVYP